MKRIKTVNGYAIYQAMSQRDADNYNCEVGCFNLYISADIRDYGLANSYPEYDNIDSLAAALELANGSNYAIASALAEELSDSTIQDMDLVMEIERRLDAGETVEQIAEKYDTINQTFEENEEDNNMATTTKRFSDKQLWAFVNRADTHEKIQIASDFLTKLEYLDVDVYDDMMNALAYKSRELYRHDDEDEIEDYDEYLDSYRKNQDEYGRYLCRCREYNL